MARRRRTLAVICVVAAAAIALVSGSAIEWRHRAEWHALQTRKRGAATLYQEQVRRIQGNDLQGARAVLDEMLRDYLSTWQAESSVKAQARAEGKAVGRSPLEQLEVWSHEGNPEPLRQVARFAHIDLTTLSSPSARVAGFHTYTNHYRGGYWVIQAYIRMGMAQVQVGDYQAAEASARAGMRLGPDILQSRELRTIDEAARESLADAHGGRAGAP